MANAVIVLPASGTVAPFLVRALMLAHRRIFALLIRERVGDKMRLTHASCLAALAIAATAAQGAEVIYRSVAPDGEVTYSYKPQPGARETATIEIRTLSPEQRRAAQRLRAEEQASSAGVAALDRQWRRVDAEIIAAQKALARSEKALQSGRTPLPGERRGSVGGGSRLSEAYFQRLHGLEVAVEQAKQRLDRAYAARNALK